MYSSYIQTVSVRFSNDSIKYGRNEDDGRTAWRVLLWTKEDSLCKVQEKEDRKETEGMDRQEALNLAINYCIDHNILSEFLQRYRAEVLGMLLEEIDMDAYERTIMEEAREDGMEEGIKEGMEQGTDRAAALVGKLLELNRMEDLRRMTTDRGYREKLFQEFGL